MWPVTVPAATLRWDLPARAMHVLAPQTAVLCCIALAMSSMDSPGLDSPGRSPLLAVEARGRQEPELLHCYKKQDGTSLELLWRATDGSAVLGGATGQSPTGRVLHFVLLHATGMMNFAN